MFGRVILLIVVFLQLIQLSDGFSMKLQKRQKEEPKSNFLKQNDVFGEIVSSRLDNTLYEGMISLGSPAKPFRVILDTGSGILWVPKYGCKNTGRMGEYCESGTGTYDPNKSKTSKSLNQNFTIEYGIGETVGQLYSDQFAFGDPACNHQLKLKQPIVFGAGTEIEDGDQGILGLGFARDDEKATSIFGRAVEEGIMTEPLFTVVYRSCPYDQDECSEAGIITFGKIDTENCGTVVGKVKLNRFALQWEFSLQEVSTGNYKSNLKDNDVITDSGASHIFLPFDVVEDLMSTIGATSEGSSYFISCKRKWQINFKINGTDYAVKAKEMVFNLGNDRCEIAIRSKVHQPWVLGGPWLRSFCQIHHWTNREIGFARIK